MWYAIILQNDHLFLETIEVDIAAVSQQSTLDLIHHMTSNEAFISNNELKSRYMFCLSL